MSYSCDDPEVPRVNYFSNPDVTYLDKPTGTETENNARAIKEIMVSFQKVSQSLLDEQHRLWLHSCGVNICPNGCKGRW